jgi:hypothetical protein
MSNLLKKLQEKFEEVGIDICDIECGESFDQSLDFDPLSEKVETFNLENVDEYSFLLPGKVIITVERSGGGEGEGEAVHRVVGIFDILEVDLEYEKDEWGNKTKAVMFTSEGVEYIRYTGFYSSYNGTDWDSISYATQVYPSPKTVVDWSEKK